MLEEAVSGYLDGLPGHQHHFQPEDIQPVARVMREAKTRRWRHLAEERIGDVTPSIPIGRKFWSLSDEERSHVDALFESKSVHALIEQIHGKGADHLKVVDAAYWMKGCSSLGLLRYAVLARTGKKNQTYHLSIASIIIWR